MGKHNLIKCSIIIIALLMVCSRAGAEERETYEALSLDADDRLYLSYCLAIEDDLTVVRVYETIPASEYIREGEALPVPDVYVSENEVYEVVNNLS